MKGAREHKVFFCNLIFEAGTRPEIVIGCIQSNQRGLLAREVTSYPGELDDHVRIFGMRADEFTYTDELCPTCENRIDSLGLCGHGNIGGD